MFERADTGPMEGLIRDVMRPRVDVWRMWTDPELLQKWFWSVDEAPEVTFDPRAGRRWRVSVDTESVGGQITAVEEGERIAFTMRRSGSKRTHEVDVRFLDEPGGGTTVEVSIVGFRSQAEKEQSLTWWNSALNRLGTTIPPK